MQRRDSSFEGYIDEIRRKCYGILWRQDWFVIDRFKDGSKRAHDYIDANKFNNLVLKGINSIANNRIDELRDILREILKLPVKSSGGGENDFVNIIRG